MPRATAEDRVGALGVTHVQLFVEQSLQWIFRRQEHRDTGIDAHVEVVLSGEATGLVLALQIKTGASYFAHPTGAGWRYRGGYPHLRYWNEQNLAVVLILVDEVNKKAFWVHIGEGAAIKRSTASWTIEIPRNQPLSVSCATTWMNLAWATTPPDALYRYCRIHSHYMEAIAAGGRVLVEADDWINKTRGQAEFRILVEDSDGDIIRSESWSFFAGVENVYEFARSVFPWATIGIDEDFYEDNEQVPPGAVFQDSDSPGGYFVIEGERPDGIRPFRDTAGEVAHYRFELELNEVGRAFLVFKSSMTPCTIYPPYYLARRLPG